jgi:hypothetical protein
MGFALAAIAAVAAVCCLGYSIPKPLIGPHGFRQTQNAISSYYSVKEHASVFHNIMPVLGRPWDLPTELPLFQYLAGCLYWLSGMPLDACGRLISAVFWLACVVLCMPLLRLLDVQEHDLWIPCVILLSCPLYLFWGATYMMETMALFLSLSFLYAVMRCSIAVGKHGEERLPLTILRDNRFWLWFLVGLSTGTLAALQKASTWIIAFGVAALFVSWAGRQTRPWRLALMNLWFLPMFGIPYFVARSWFEYGDVLKKQNPFVRDMFVFSNEKFRHWNYGTFEQKVSAETWGVIVSHMQEGVFLSIPPFDHLAMFVVLIAGAIVAAKRRPHIAFLLAAFTVGPLVFTNLYYVHNYYVCATGVWMLLAIGLAIVGVAEKQSQLRWPRLSALVITIAVAGAGFGTWATGYLPILQSFATHGQLKAAWTEPVQRMIPLPRTLLILGSDWNPVALYYAERKGIGWPDSMLQEFPGPRFKEAMSLLRPEEAIGAVVFNERLVTEANAPAIAKILDDLGMSENGMPTPFGVLFLAMDLQQ